MVVKIWLKPLKGLAEEVSDPNVLEFYEDLVELSYQFVDQESSSTVNCHS
jgi:hypothetical protein